MLDNGWWRSGDLARRDADGNFTIVDRKKDMIVSGGYNVYSIEVEQVLSRHTGVAQVAVIGTADPRWGEAITAFMVIASDGRPEEAELEALCRAELAGYKIPKRFIFIDAMPMTTTGKIRRIELRERGAD